MKDYYYILGVSKTASPDEIKKAYRKLSLKFHPDKNDGDKFFEDRFKEISEAYETLFDPIRRFNYDEYSTIKDTSQQTTSSPYKTSTCSSPPQIISFSADKSFVDIGDIITFEWRVENANSVELKPFGKVALVGNKKIKIGGFNTPDGLVVSLIARHDTNNIQIEERLRIKEKIVYANQQNAKSSDNLNYRPLLGLFIVILPVVIIALVANYNSKTEVISPIPVGVSDSTSASITDLQMNENSVVTEELKIDGYSKVAPDSNAAQPILESVSHWKGNQLENGSSPFNNCFNKGKRGGRSWILFQNQNGVDAVVCLINSVSGITIRNEYIRAGANFEMSNVPVGTYYVKVLYGNDWNPNLTSPCGSVGFFESDISFSVSDGYSDAINVESINNGYSVQYSTHTVTLYPVANGNMSQRGIEASQFFGH